MGSCPTSCFSLGRLSEWALSRSGYGGYPKLANAWRKRFSMMRRDFHCKEAWQALGKGALVHDESAWS